MIKKTSFFIKNSNKDFFFLLSLYFFDKKVFFSFYHLKNKLNVVLFNLIYLPFLLYKDFFTLIFKGIFMRSALRLKDLKFMKFNKKKNFSKLPFYSKVSLKYILKFRTYFLNIVSLEKQVLYNRYQWRKFFRIKDKYKAWRRKRRFFRRRKIKRFLKRYNRQVLNRFSLNWRKLILFKNNGKKFGRKFKLNLKSKKKKRVKPYFQPNYKPLIKKTNISLIKYRRLKSLSNPVLTSVIYTNIIDKVSKYLSKKNKSIAKRRDFVLFLKNDMVAWLRFKAFRNLHFKYIRFIKKKKKLYFTSKVFLQNYFSRNAVLYSLAQTTQRLYFYDSYTKQNELTPISSDIFLIWKKKIMHSSYRLRFVDYIFFSLLIFRPNKGAFSKITYIFTFFKYFFLLRKYLLVKKLDFTKNFLYSSNLKSLKRLKISKKFKSLKFGKNKYKKSFNLLKREPKKSYFSLLKYLNNFLNLTYVNLDLSKSFFINKSFVYLSYILSVIFVDKRISVLSFDNFFSQKYWNSYKISWLINDSVLKFNEILDMASVAKKNLHLDYVSNLKNLAKKKISTSYFFLNDVKTSWNKNALFFFCDRFINKKATIIYKLKRNYYFFIYNLVTFYIFLNLNLYFLINILLLLQNCNVSSKSFKGHLSFNKFTLNLTFIKVFYLKFSKILYFFSQIKKNNINLKFILSLKILNIARKKKFFYKVLVSFILNLFLIFFRYFFFKNIILKKNFINTTKYYNFIDNFMYDSFFSNFLLRKKEWFSGKFNNNTEILYTKFFINPTDNYYSKYHRHNLNNKKKAILHLIERNSNVFLVLSKFKSRKVLGHCSGGQGLDRDYVNTKRRKKGTRALTTIINLKFYKKSRKNNLKNLFILSDNLYDFRLHHLSKHWVRKFKLGIPYLRGIKTLFRIPHHKGLKLFKKKRK